MAEAWRIVKKRHVRLAFDGEGARRYGGRWNSPGTSVVYASQSRALCLLEVLAGIRSVTLIKAYLIIPIRFDDSLATRVEPRVLPAEWRQSPPPPSTQQIGDRWAEEQRSVILRVPSSIVPDESNYLINPAHPDFVRMEIGAPEELSIDSRLLR
jgi:RES domain-containing protein